MDDAKPYERPEWFRPVLAGLQSSHSTTRKLALGLLWCNSGVVGPLRASVMLEARNPDMAMEIVVDVFADLPEAIRKLDLAARFTSPSCLWAFLYDMAQRRCRNHLRKRRCYEHRFIACETVPECPEIVRPAPDGEVRQRARELLKANAGKLSPAEWKLLFEAKVEEYTADELARKYGCSVAAMHKRIQRAHAKVRGAY
jgi:RNA polymerase sigma factor (sigma-70 family)